MTRPNDLENWVDDDDSAKIQEPISAKKLAGFINLERIPHQFLNWLFNRFTKWINHFDNGLNHFAPSEVSTPDMTVEISAGRLLLNNNITFISNQSSPIITAPTVDPRIDRIGINIDTGLIEVITGVENASPTAPSYNSNHFTICQILLSVGHSSIVNADITDERSVVALSYSPLKTTIIEIGDWDMDVTAQVNIAHGLTYSKIRCVSAVIRDNADSNTYNFPHIYYSTTSDEYISWSSTLVTLKRSTSGKFDTANFNSTPYNRGWIIIQHTI